VALGDAEAHLEHGWCKRLREEIVCAGVEHRGQDIGSGATRNDNDYAFGRNLLGA